MNHTSTIQFRRKLPNQFFVFAIQSNDIRPTFTKSFQNRYPIPSISHLYRYTYLHIGIAQSILLASIYIYTSARKRRIYPSTLIIVVFQAIKIKLIVFHFEQVFKKSSYTYIYTHTWAEGGKSIWKKLNVEKKIFMVTFRRPFGAFIRNEKQIIFNCTFR